MSNHSSNVTPLFRIALFLVCGIAILLASIAIYSFANTLHQLDAIESERDEWQRPSEVLQALDLRDGNTVVDLGSGAGYFSLKLLHAVGKRGQVIAVDLRRLSLFFLWTRALLRGQSNVHLIVGESDNPRLPAGIVDAALICNSYHEFRNPGLMLTHVFRSLRRGGHLVVVDRAPRASEAEHTHETPLTVVRSELRRNGFEILGEDDLFIDRPANDSWWLLNARKP